MAENVFMSYVSASMEGNTMISHAGCSGILIARDCVLAHGSILDPVLSRSADSLRFFTALNSGDLVRTPDGLIDDLTFQIRRSHSSFKDESAKLVAVWRCPLLKETLDVSLASFTFNNQRGFNRLLLSVFLVIKFSNSLETSTEQTKAREKNTFAQDDRSSERRKIEQILSQLANQAATGQLTKGAIVELISTPFGNPFFRDSTSHGIVGNLLGVDDCLILVDVTSFPGCEGSPIFSTNDRGERSICGMVIASLIQCRGEWMNCTFAANLLPSLKLILRDRVSKGDFQYSSYAMPLPCRIPTRKNILEKSVAIVKCGPNWGTGTLLDEQSGTFVTCAHVVTMAPETTIKLATSHADRYEWFAEASLIYKTSNEQPYDVAVLKIDRKFKEHSMKAIKLADRDAQTGEQILSIGFPISLKGRPTVSSGVVSKSSKHMLQTNCCVYSGVSGGPIVRRANFEMLGIVVCNVALSNDSLSYPRLCMAIPTVVLKNPLDDYLRTA
ncbi:unnamed protein product, partial [Heterotrigona itama]